MAMPATGRAVRAVPRRLHDVRRAGRPPRLRRAVHRGPHRPASGWRTCTRSGRPDWISTVPTFDEFWARGPAAAAHRRRAVTARATSVPTPWPTGSARPAGASRSSPATSTGSATTTARAIRRGTSPTSGWAVHRAGAIRCTCWPTSPRSRLHSQLDGGETSRTRKCTGANRSGCIPADAQRAGWPAATWCGCSTTAARAWPASSSTTRLRHGVVQLSTGAWYDPRGPGRPGRDVRARQSQRAHRGRRHVVVGQGLHRRSRAGARSRNSTARCRRCGHTSRRRSSSAATELARAVDDRSLNREGSRWPTATARSWSEPDRSRTGATRTAAAATGAATGATRSTAGGVAAERRAVAAA